MTPSFNEKRMTPRYPVRIPLRLRLLKSPMGEKMEAQLHNGNNLMSDIGRTGFF